MGKAADQARRLAAGKAAADAAHVVTPAPEIPDAVTGGTPAVRPSRVRDIRRTVNLSPVEHRQLAV